MIFRLDKTTIYFKQFFTSAFLNKKSFLKLCQKTNEFPLKEDYAEINGLYLSGDHFFKKILFSEAEEVAFDEIQQIKRITPIVEHSPMPFILEQNYFEVNIPTAGKSFEKLMESVACINDYLDDMFEDASGKKIEIHLRGGAGESSTGQIFSRLIPCLPEGTYQYKYVINGKLKNGEISFPESRAYLLMIPEIENGIRSSHPFQLICNKNKLILKQTKRNEIGLSLYSDKFSWFKEALDAFVKTKLLSPFDTVTHHKLPQLGVKRQRTPQRQAA